MVSCLWLMVNSTGHVTIYENTFLVYGEYGVTRVCEP